MSLIGSYNLSLFVVYMKNTKITNKILGYFDEIDHPNSALNKIPIITLIMASNAVRMITHEA